MTDTSASVRFGICYSGSMRKVLLKSGKVVEVENNEAHRLIDQEGAKLVTSVPRESTYRNRVMTPNKGKPYVTKRKRTNHSS